MRRARPKPGATFLGYVDTLDLFAIDRAAKDEQLAVRGFSYLWIAR